MEEDEVFVRQSNEVESMVSVTLGRVMNTILTARPRKLNDAVSRLSSDPRNKPSTGSLDESLWFLHKFVKDAAEKKESLDEILVPMLENSLRSKDLKHLHGSQSMILLNWLFQDELLFEAIATNLVKIIASKDERFIALGWCTLVRGLVEYESSDDQNQMNGIRQRQIDTVKTFSSCISHLSRIVCKGSTLQDGFELPSRLAASAADCFLVLTESLTKGPAVPSNRQKSSDSNAPNRRVALLASDNNKAVNTAQKLSDVSNVEKGNLLWDHLEEIILLVQKLLAWNRKSRPLHAKGLEQVLRWLQEIKDQYNHAQVEAGSRILKSGVLLLFSCWKHYSVLLRLEGHKVSQCYKELLEQFLSGLQFYTDNHLGGDSENKSSGAETRKFFLNCLCLLLGRFDRKKFASVVSEYGPRISYVILPQLHCVDEDVTDGVVCILKAVIFKPQFSSGSGLPDNREIGVVLPLLINLLDEQDGTARAVVMLLAEYCLMSRDEQCLHEVLKRLASGIVQQRRNAIEVISELIRISSESDTVLPQLSWQNIANHLLERLEDEEIAIQEQASSLFPMIDPSLFLLALIHLVSSRDERVRSSSSDALVRVLKYHSQNPEVICMFLDCLGNINQSLDLQKSSRDTGEGSKLVENWSILIGPLIDKLFAEPSNATIVRFLSLINRQLAESADLVLQRIVSHTKGQMDMNESSFSSNDSACMQQLLFEHLCPLLIIRMLPLSVFNDLNSSIMYGQLINRGHSDIEIFSHDCIASLLFKRAFYRFEFENVRKLAAELCGRIHPQVLIPIVAFKLEQAGISRDFLVIKACLFSVCTSLVVRGRESLSQPGMPNIRRSLEKILLWPSLDEDEVSKAQHGCIDCLALMICAELQASESLDDSNQEKFIVPGKKIDSGDAASRNTVLSYVINQLTSDKKEHASTSQLGGEIGKLETPVTFSFQLCMANVIISACQKISDSGKKPLARKALPLLIQSIEAITQSDIRAACIQVLFSAVYHLKSAILPYSSNLLKISLKALRKGSEKEKMAGAKLMASLMGSDDAILESISGGLVEARSVLSNISLTDPSVELRQICTKLLACITYT
ncbi:hypothetical protein UlMin_043080 [Ulmus minor]